MHVVARNDTSHLPVLALQKHSNLAHVLQAHYDGTHRHRLGPLQSPGALCETPVRCSTLHCPLRQIWGAVAPPPVGPALQEWSTLWEVCTTNALPAHNVSSYIPFWGSCRQQCWMMDGPPRRPFPPPPTPATKLAVSTSHDAACGWVGKLEAGPAVSAY